MDGTSLTPMTSATVRPRKQLPCEMELDNPSCSEASENGDPTSTLCMLKSFQPSDAVKDKNKYQPPETAQKWWNILQHFRQEKSPSIIHKNSGRKRTKRPWSSLLPSNVDDIILEHALRAEQLEFLRRSEVVVYVCDFYEKTAIVKPRKMADYEDICMHKPDGVALRWIHVPVGKGLFQSTLEEIFLHSDGEGVRKPNTFVHAGLPEWHYPEMSMISFVNREDHKARIEAVEKLSTLPAFKHLPYEEGLCPTVEKDLKWRKKLFNKPDLGFWELVQADFPAIIAERICLRQNIGPLSGASTSRDFKPQVLSQHEQFAKASMVMNTLRGFDRADGFVLTFANTSGVDYLTHEFKKLIESPGYDFLYHPGASVLAHAMEAFTFSGVSRWKRKCSESTAAWFLVYLFTEAAVTPHHIRGGRTAIEILDGYLQERKKDEPWVYGQSPRLVRQYQGYMSEIKAIKSITTDSMNHLRLMLRDVEDLEKKCNHVRCAQDWAKWGGGDDGNSSTDEVLDEGRCEPETMTQRLNWAIKLLDDRSDDLRRIEEHFEKSLKNLIDVCTIEQNDRSVVADTMNKAILVFTAITVVFLPLSFITSYLGMNLSDVRETHLNQGHFWKWVGAPAFSLSFLGLFWTWLRRGRNIGDRV